ncbi:cytochrome P450 [Saccharopolyspora sp. HNM0983]|uniref:Cytochrome P450 n=1 Tax=Saccharopolyspora montiporae TaxID=2781240 RepID=A0A929FWA3_9PSEU|nr:cytochrome P450 [Saccharopolyspora sp. HNM0983]
MSVTATAGEVNYDPYDVEINKDPYPTFRRLREDVPLYYNEQHDFYALSRFEDVRHGLTDRDTFISGRGAILELIKAGIDIPPGVVIFEDPPIHTIHRNLLSRMFTPRKIKNLEPEIRELCVRSLDPHVGTGRFDFVNDLGKQMPMRVISKLLGIPEEDQEAVRDSVDAELRTEAGKPMPKYSEDGEFSTGEIFEQYIDWRTENPSDDIMTELLNVDFEDETGTTRKLTREELLTYLNVVAGAGNETTTRLIGWAGKVLADHPEQRQQLVENPALIPQAVEELLRFEAPAPHVARYMTRDVTYFGQTVPEGNVMMMLIGSANRDDRQFPDGDRFDIHREARQHLTFGLGGHFCLGSALARLEGRIALEEVLKRFPEWDVDTDNATLSPTSTVRGWETLPVLT